MPHGIGPRISEGTRARTRQAQRAKIQPLLFEPLIQVHRDGGVWIPTPTKKDVILGVCKGGSRYPKYPNFKGPISQYPDFIGPKSQYPKSCGAC